MTDHVDRFLAAVKVLAGHGHIKQRLIQAFEDHLDEIGEGDIPVAMKQAFSDLKFTMHAVSPLNGEGPVCASVRKMSVMEASACAVSIVSMYAELRDQGDSGQTFLPLQQEDSERVPPFLVKTN
jgi:hypothetical protein